MKFEGKSRRLRERMKLTLPVRVHGRETPSQDWVELSRLLDVTPFGARFTLVRPIEPGRMLHLTLPLPRQLRCFDHVEDQYRIWALVRNVAVQKPNFDKPQATTQQQRTALRFEVGVAFTGKHPPASYLKDPMMRYEVESFSAASSQWRLREKPTGDSRPMRAQETRLQIPVPVLVEVLDGDGRVQSPEQTVTENLSRRGAAVWTTRTIERGRFVRLTSMEHGLSLIAVVRACRMGTDGIPRLHLEFVDGRWPLDGVE